MEESAIRIGVGRRWATSGLVVILVLANGFAAGTAEADSDENGAAASAFDSKFLLALGGFFPRIDGTFSLSPSGGGSGGDISLEDDLGFDESSASVWIGLTWRFLPRHTFTAEWFQLDRSGSTSAGRQFTIGDTTILAGAALDSKMDLNLGRLTYGYSILRDEKLDLSILAGLHVATAKVTATATGSLVINGVPVANGSSTESSSALTFPLPHLGGSISYKISPRWTAQASVLGFALALNQYSGSLVEVDAGASYQLSKNFGIGAGLKYFNLNLQAKETGRAAEFEYSFFGPAVFGYATF